MSEGTPRESRVEHLRARVQDTTTRVTETATAMRKRSETVDAVYEAYERDRRGVGNVLAGAVAFRLFVYLLPVSLATVTILGIFSSVNEEGTKDAGGSIGMSRYLIDTVADAASQSRRGLWALIPLSLWALYTAGGGALKVLRSVHAFAWNEPVTKLKGRVSGAAGLFGAAVAVLGLVALLQWIRKESYGLGLASALLASLVFAAGWLLASWLLPHGDAPWTALIPGALLVGLGVEALHVVSVYYLGHKIHSASELYGGLGAAAAILAWLYLIGRLMVASAMLNATLWERRIWRKPADGPAP